ncbi:glycosyltransferase family 2 protein [Cohnella zeiphila]|uniref:Glycosyltransferase family 2 protein n=1 Tax=Cohnella zeiphila TaxID=2761120 RepID=A0A7X0SH82_9BACL|nr:glycosyltransferase family 2 protein [Cohnella zeiphila]MBB6729949.1 glycosyltransferase family 2 protein [Cohnella zeiphila]
MVELSVVVPVFNEEENVARLYEAVSEAVRGKVSDYEIVLIDDGSTDGSAPRMDAIAAADARVKAYHFERNCGQTSAIWAGLRKADGRYVALIDADLQTDPADIFTLMPYMREYDLANGMRTERRDTWLKRVSSRIANGFRNWVTQDRIRDTGCPMKLMKKEVANSFYLYEGFHRFLPTLARMNGFRVIEVPVRHRPREYGSSKYGMFNRLFVSLMDAFVIGWLRRRVIRYRIRGE